MHRPAVIVDGVVKVAIAHVASIASTNRAAHFAVSTTIRDATQLLDIHMHQITRRGTLVATRPRPAHRQAGVLSR
jgi:hypothetical protein